jgi:hypothetical protein
MHTVDVSSDCFGLGTLMEINELISEDITTTRKPDKFISTSIDRGQQQQQLTPTNLSRMRQLSSSPFAVLCSTSTLPDLYTTK